MNIVASDSFNFSELRYSDAIDKHIELKGEITFLQNGLKIFYPKFFKSLHYENDSLIYEENDQKIDLSEVQAGQIMSYFDILILLHKGDEKAYDGVFNVAKEGGLIILEPIGSIKNYIKNIEMLKEKGELRQVKFFLKNNDSITISIDEKI